MLGSRRAEHAMHDASSTHRFPILFAPLHFLHVVFNDKIPMQQLQQ
jgi:hypothetical protein